jgi:hypothetical protein
MMATKDVTVTVAPKKPAGAKVKAGKKKLNVSWKKVPLVDGYQITYATNSKFKKAKNVNVPKGSTVKKEIKKLKKGKNYWVKVRAYKKDGKNKIFGAYSKPIKKKVK